MDAAVPAGARFLDFSDMQQSGVTVWSVWEGSRIAGIGVLKTLPDGSGEIKSMRTHPDVLGRGAGSRILVAIIDAAQARRFWRLSLETCSGPSFEAARSLYERFGFRLGEAFADYKQNKFNHFLHLDLNPDDQLPLC